MIVGLIANVFRSFNVANPKVSFSLRALLTQCPAVIKNSFPMLMQFRTRFLDAAFSRFISFVISYNGESVIESFNDSHDVSYKSIQIETHDSLKRLALTHIA